MEKKFLVCEICGNVGSLIIDKGIELHCCGTEMQEVKANSTDAATEKHVPIVEKTAKGVKVTVGSVMHPMEASHLINHIYVQTDKGGYGKDLVAGEQPVVEFDLNGETPVAVYEYCNLHGLWVTEVK